MSVLFNGVYSILVILVYLDNYSAMYSNEQAASHEYMKKQVMKKIMNRKLMNKMTNQPIVLDSCGLTNVKTEQVDDKIITGHEAKDGQFPYQVLLRMKRKDGRVMICGG